MSENKSEQYDFTMPKARELLRNMAIVQVYMDLVRKPEIAISKHKLNRIKGFPEYVFNVLCEIVAEETESDVNDVKNPDKRTPKQQSLFELLSQYLETKRENDVLKTNYIQALNNLNNIKGKYSDPYQTDLDSENISIKEVSVMIFFGIHTDIEPYSFQGLNTNHLKEIKNIFHLIDNFMYEKEKKGEADEITLDTLIEWICQNYKTDKKKILTNLKTIHTENPDLIHLISIIPNKHLIPNNKLANSLAKEQLINVGAVDIVVSPEGRKKEIKTRCVLSYEGDNLKLTSKQPFTEYDRNVADAVASLYEYGDESHIITAATVYRTMVHATESETPSTQQIEAVTNSLDKMRFIRVQIDCTDELAYRNLSLNGEQITSGKIDTYLLALEKTEIIAGGQIVEGYEIIKEPILYTYSKLVRQILTVPASLLDIRDSTGGKVSNTELRIEIKGYLLRRISVMNGKTKQSNKILYESLYEQIYPKQELSRKKQQQIRDYIVLVLNYWTKEKFINGYIETKTGNKKTGIEILF